MIRSILLAVAILVLGSTSFAQTTTAANTNADAASKNVSKLSGYKKMDYFHFEISWLNWQNQPDSVKVKPLSHAMSVYFTYPMQLGKSNFSFVPGLGIAVDNVYLNATPKYDSAKTSIFLSPIKTGVSYKMNKQTLSYITLPVAFNFTSKPDKNSKSWKASLSLRFDYLLDTHTKYKGNNLATGNAEKTKTYGIPFINKYRFDASFTVGYDWIYLVGTYGLTNYISTGKGPQYHPYSIGIGVVGF